ncbi:hypothetical protein AXG93_215s1050 [Marchantia polymorpha subsp. ruderalis]|uniref:Uncharacterized protein n=1 Tax=Marchantia polymorpha subsp. ruderalis TaxID=1480154 RepID=A0A176W1A5_MARPO|nr:hypothetical protein AXG93_215s1050 [Marchantia polymorpha subsp. ruderalis]
MRFFVLSTVSRCLAAETLVARAALPASAAAATALKEPTKDASAVTNAHATASEKADHVQTADLYRADEGLISQFGVLSWSSTMNRTQRGPVVDQVI